MNNTLKKNNICAVIPFYNEKENLSKLIKNTLLYSDKIILVNDGSNDDFFWEIPKSEKVNLISYQKNKGKGFALKKGFEKSIKLNSDYTVTLDADLQHDPAFIPKLLSENYDIVIGNRLTDISNMPFHRIMSNKLTSLLLSIKTKQKILDSQCGFRTFKTKILKDILPKSNGFEAESEMLILAAKQNYKIGFVNIPTIYRNEKSKMKPFKTILGFIKILFS